MNANDDNKYSIPDGYTIIRNSAVLMLVRADEADNNPGVCAVCFIQDGEQELLRRFYAAQESRGAKVEKLEGKIE